MSAPFSFDVRARLAGIHKASLGAFLLQFIFTIVVIGLAASLVGITAEAKDKLDNSGNAPVTSSSEAAEEKVFELIDMVRKVANAYAVPLLILQLLGVLAYGYLKRGAVIGVTVFQSIGIVYGIIMLVIPLLEAAAFTVICEDAKNNVGGLSPFGVVVCGPLKSRFHAVAGVMGFTVAITFVQSVLGCVGVSQISDNYKGFDRDKL